LETSAEPIVVALRGAAEASSAAPNAPSAMAFMEFSLRLDETIDLYGAAFRDSTLAWYRIKPPFELGLAPEVSQWQLCETEKHSA